MTKVWLVSDQFANDMARVARPADKTTPTQTIRKNIKKVLAQFAGTIGSKLPPSPAQLEKYARWAERVSFDPDSEKRITGETVKQSRLILKKFGEELLLGKKIGK